MFEQEYENAKQTYFHMVKTTNPTPAIVFMGKNGQPMALPFPFKRGEFPAKKLSQALSQVEPDYYIFATMGASAEGKPTVVFYGMTRDGTQKKQDMYWVRNKYQADYKFELIPSSQKARVYMELPAIW